MFGWLFKKQPQYVYGWVHRIADDTRRDGVRLNTKTGRVEFVLWKAGEQGHDTDYWHEMGIGWEQFFRPYERIEAAAERRKHKAAKAGEE